ncbi:MAG: efflux RND transporter permease subunit [Alistipes sp.]|nr:efflux RND transporter permease subunit [Alistipes sp.]
MGEFFIRRPVFALSLTVAITLAGIVALTRLAIAQFPDITPPVVQVTTSYVGADAETINETVATPLGEQAIGVSDLLYMQSTSANDGSMSLQLTFEVGSSPDMNAIFTQNNISSATASLPQSVVEQGVSVEKSNTGFLMVYALASDGRYDDEFLSNYAYINLEDRLAKINGVGKVQIMGAGEYAMRIWLHPERLHYYSLSAAQVMDAIRTQSGVYPAGKFGAEPTAEDVAYTYTVRLPAAYSTAEEFSSILLTTDATGAEVRLRDVADVELGSASYAIRSLTGRNPSTLVVIYQEPASNAVEVGKRVKEVMNEQEAALPDGIEIYTVVDATQNIKAGVKDIARTLVIALVLVIAIIYLFLQDWRSTLIPLVAVPVSLIGTFTVFPLLGFSMNVISLLALVLAIGLVVDDAIVVVEAAQVGIERGLNPREATVEAMRRVQSPIIATTVVLLAVFIPISFMEGITGQLFRQFSVTLSTAITLSAFNALTLSPALCAMLLKPRKGERRGLLGRFNAVVERNLNRYGERIVTFVQHTLRTALIVAVMAVAILLCWRTLPTGFLPVEDEGYMMVLVTTPDASSLDTTLRAMQHAEKIITSHPAVEYTSLAAGFDMMAGVGSTSSGVIFVVLKDFKQRNISASALAAELNTELYSLPEAECYAIIPPSIPGLGISSNLSLQVQDLQGQGTEWLYSQAQMLMDSLRKEPSIATVSTTFHASTPQRMLRIDREQAMSEGVELADIYSTLGTMLGGTYSGNFNRFGRQYRIYAQASPDAREDSFAINRYYVPNAHGQSVPLAAFVSVEDTVGVEYITQFDLYESIMLSITPAEGISSGEAMAAVERTADRVLPPTAATAWSGLSYQQAKARSGAGVVYLVALIFVFLALSSLYESWALPVAILLSVPAAIAGALVAMLVAHAIEPTYVNNIYVQISLIMLIGLAAKNAILVVEYADRRRAEGNLTAAEAATEAARERARPIIMTALAFILGIMPLIFATGNFSTARNIMGVALAGGMIVATTVGLLLYPAAYFLVESLRSKFSKDRTL